MTTRRDIFKAFAPESLERSSHLPTSHRQVIRAIPPCPSGHYGQSLSQCPSGGEHHRVQHACGNRHCLQCQPHTPQQWRSHHLEQQRHGPHFLRTCTVPATRRPFIRSPQRLASHAMGTASSLARTRLAHDERFLGTDLPGCTGVLHPWGRQLQSHPHLHDMVPGGGLSKDRTPWRPSRATVFVPVKALSPLSRALFKAAMRHAGLLEHIAPQVWTIPWNVHSQANPHGHSAFPSLAPSVCRVAIAHRRIVSRNDRTVPFPSRKPGRSRPCPTALDAVAFLRRFLPHVVPHGVMKVRHFGVLHASGAIPPDTRRRMLVPARPIDCEPPRIAHPAPLATFCPTCGAPMRLVLRRWTSHRACVDTSCEGQCCQDNRGATRCVQYERYPCVLRTLSGSTGPLMTGSQPPTETPKRVSSSPMTPLWRCLIMG